MRNIDFNTLLRKVTYIIVLLLALGMLIMVFSSCRTSGYGCHGKMTWKQLERKNNRMY
jgi:hypothetical protein